MCFFLISCHYPRLCDVYIMCNPETTDCEAEYEKAKKAMRNCEFPD